MTRLTRRGQIGSATAAIGSVRWRCRQTSSATPALEKFVFNNQGTNYTVSVRARKTSGAEGFLVGFGARSSQDYYWLNLGGWNNTVHRLEKSVDGERNPIGPAVNGNIETGRWYDIEIQVAGHRIQCFLDGQRVFDLTDDGLGGDAGANLPADNDKSNFGQALIPDMVADPSIVDIDGTFYCYATTDGWGQGLDTSGTPVVWTSKDFLNWSFEGSSFPSDFNLKYWGPQFHRAPERALLFISHARRKNHRRGGGFTDGTFSRAGWQTRYQSKPPVVSD